MKKILVLTILSTLVAACGAGTATNNNAAAPANTPANTSNAGNKATPVNTPANTSNTKAPPVKTAESAPKRITFGKDATWGTENVTLPSGGSEKFVVAAKKGQFMKISVASTEVKVFMVTKGKSEDEDEADGLTATLNANGDYVFEVHNPTGKEIKTSIRIQINENPE